MPTTPFPRPGRSLLLVLATCLLLARPVLAANPGQYVVGDIVDDAVLNERGTGNPVHLQSYEGKVIFLEWFAWWCPFCQAAASQLGQDIDQYYALTNWKNPNGVPVVHVLINLQGGQESQTQQFLNAYGLTNLPVLEDFNRVLASRFQNDGQPIFAIINGVANSPGHPQWELIYSQLGYGQTTFPAGDMRLAINSVKPSSTTGTDTTPTIDVPPMDRTVTAGDSVMLGVTATGTNLAYQWYKGTAAIDGATNSTLSFNPVATTDAGTYHVVVSNGAGSATSGDAVLTVNPASAGPPSAPKIDAGYASGPTEVTLTWQPPPDGTTATGYKIERATDSTFDAGLTAFDLTTTSTSYIDTTALAGTTYYYRVSATNADGVSPAARTIQVATPTSPRTGAAAFADISTRADCGTGNNVAIGGFVVSGHAPKRVLIRAVGPTLTTQGIGQAEVLQDPMIELHDAIHGNTVIATNDNWGDNGQATDVAAAITQVGAGAFAAGDTTSSALLMDLQPGVYSFVVTGKNSTTGIVLIEVYDTDLTDGTVKFVNISSRAHSTAGNGVTIGGFVVSGTASKQVLLRAVGPTLAMQGIGQTELLQDPTIEVHDALHGNVVIATNDNWGDNANASDIVTAQTRLGATPLAGSDATSAVLLLTLPPGVYSFVASGKAGATGIVLVEVYDAD